MPIYHLIAWGIPVLVAFPLLCTGKLPFAPFVGGLWCYVTVHGSFQHVEPFSEKHIAVAVSVKLPEFFAFVIIVLLYSATVINIRRQVSFNTFRLVNVPLRMPAYTVYTYGAELECIYIATNRVFTIMM